MLTLYDYLDSGNGYKVRLLLSQLGTPYELVELDILKGETRTEAFLRLNPNGRVPVLRLEDGTCLAESNAILVYLAEETPFWPDTRLHRAQALQWMFFEQYSHEPNVATPRFWLRHGGELDAERRAQLAAKQRLGHAALAVMEHHLAGREFFVAGRYSVADIALYAYTHVADQGGLALDAYPAVCAWLERVRAHPGHVPMLRDP